LIETFHLPLREISKRFTKSELVLMGWRSQEMHHGFKKRMKKFDLDSGQVSSSGKKRKQYDGWGPQDMPDHFFTQEEMRDDKGRLIASPGDFNLGLVKGEEARRYFEMKLGIPMPPGVSRVKPDIGWEG